ncbi:MAG: hypothetical protein R2758_09835 [Bacteroidales bacterium]
MSLSEVAADTNGWVFPALFRSGNCWINLTESWPDRNYCGSHLAKGNGANELILLSPSLRRVIPMARYSRNQHCRQQTPCGLLPLAFPGVIAESTHGTDLALPPVEGDFSYVRPGRAAWSWALMKDRSVNYEVRNSLSTMPRRWAGNTVLLM